MSAMRSRIRKQRRSGRRSSSYESVMRTLLLQNQQIIIQQQNMMFMLIKQHYPASTHALALANTVAATSAASSNTTNTLIAQHQPHMKQQPLDNFSQHSSQQPIQSHQPQSQSTHLQQNQPQQQQQQQQQTQPTQQQTQPQHQQQTQPQHQQAHPQMHLDDSLSALLESDGLMTNNLLYNPNTDIGSITPFKAHMQDQDHHESPPYYSSESLTTPRVEHRPQTTVNVSQNVVKNLNDSFKSPTKPAKINVQILSGSATRELKNSKAKIIQSMNISEFLRQVHPDEPIRSSQ